MGGVSSSDDSLPCAQKDLVWDFITVQIMPYTPNRSGPCRLEHCPTLSEKQFLPWSPSEHWSRRLEDWKGAVAWVVLLLIRLYLLFLVVTSWKNKTQSCSLCGDFYKTLDFILWRIWFTVVILHLDCKKHLCQLCLHKLGLTGTEILGCHALGGSRSMLTL